MSPNIADPVENLAPIFSAHLQRQAPSFYSDLDQQRVRVEFVEKWIRPASIIYRYRVGDEMNERPVLVKVPLKRTSGLLPSLNGNQPDQGGRPRLVTVASADVKFQLEYKALSLIQAHFDQLGDARFDVVRVLDFLPDHRAIVMEESSYPSLRDRFKKANRFHLSAAPDDLWQAFSNAGAWLRTYHGLSDGAYAETRQRRRADVIDALEAFADYLAYAVEDRPFFQEISQRATSLARALFPDSMPLGLGHGDYALRNILVGPGMRVAVFDTLAKWQAPIYEDIAYFLIGLKLMWSQVLSQGLMYSQSRLNECEAAFLEGYFERTPIPLKEVRLYELLMLMDKWAFWVSYVEQRGKSMLDDVRLAVMNRVYRRSARQFLDEVDNLLFRADD